MKGVDRMGTEHPSIETVCNRPLMKVNMDILADKFDKITDAIWAKMESHDTDTLAEFKFRIHLDDIVAYHDSKCPHLDEEDYIVLGQLVDMYLDSQCREEGIMYDKHEYSFVQYVVTQISAPCIDDKIYSIYKEYHLTNVRMVENE